MLIALCSASLPAAAMVSDPNWTETVFSVSRNMTGDTSQKLHTRLTWVPDRSDRLFVLEKNGRVRALADALTTTTPAWSTLAPDM